MPILLQINVTSNWGSTGKIAEQIGLCAMDHGWESYIAYGRMMNPSKNKLIKIGSSVDVYEHYIESRFFDNEGLASRHATKKFIDKIDKIKPDIVHLHNIHDHFLNYKLLFTYLANLSVPIIWTQHDQWATTGHCMYTKDECERWKIECYDCPLSKCFSLDRCRRNYILKKDLMAAIPSLTIVPVSEWLGNNILQSHLKTRPIQVIHNGIDIHTFSPQVTTIFERYGIRPEKKIILGVAAVWDERKGLRDFYALSNRLDKEQYSFVIIGKLTEKKSLEGSGCQIVFIDRTQNASELAQWYSAAFVFLNPTYQDNYPTTNLESLACGTPVITYRTGGSPEAIDERTGIVVEQGDVNGLAEAIMKLRESPLSSADCRKRAEGHFDKSRCFEEYIKLYEMTISKYPSKQMNCESIFRRL